MPSPFPGMDPFLESPVHWEGFHSHLIVFMSSQLNGLLPPDFVARVGERLYVMQPETVTPDVVLRRPDVTAGTAVLSAPGVEADAPFLLRIPSQPVRELFIDVISVRQEGKVVTAVELLSPANKVRGRGREKYVTKQEGLLPSDTHLVEIDLLRAGEHTVAASLPHLTREYGVWDYLVCLHRAGSGASFEVWPRSVRDRLPRFRVPLTDGHPDVVLDLQAAFDRAYDEGAFGRLVDYHSEPNPPLRQADVDWADALLREAGRRRDAA